MTGYKHKAITYQLQTATHYLLFICKQKVKDTPDIIKICEHDILLPNTISITSCEYLLTFSHSEPNIWTEKTSSSLFM
jgi:hypothetical protein